MFRTYNNHVRSRIICSMPWIMIFGSFVKRFANDFHLWLHHSWKLLANRITNHHTIIHSNSCIIIYILHNSISTGYSVCDNNVILIYLNLNAPTEHRANTKEYWYLYALIINWRSIQQQYSPYQIPPTVHFNDNSLTIPTLSSAIHQFSPVSYVRLMCPSQLAICQYDDRLYMANP